MWRWLPYILGSIYNIRGHLEVRDDLLYLGLPTGYNNPELIKAIKNHKEDVIKYVKEVGGRWPQNLQCKD